MTEPLHVHDFTCDKIVTFKFREAGMDHEWAIGAGCKDTDETLRAHFARWRPDARLLPYTLENARDEKRT